MIKRIVVAQLAAALILIIGCSGGDPVDDQQNQQHQNDDNGEVSTQTVRFATFNTALSDDGDNIENLSDPDYELGQQIAEAIQIKRPDVVLVQELDYDEDEESAQLFDEHFLSVPQGEQEALDYPYRYVPPTNTGVPSGYDLGNSGSTDHEEGTEEYAQDAFGYGLFPGQYGFALYSKYPIAEDEIRTFQKFLWQDMPGNLIPDDYYSDDAEEILRLSSKNHIDVPIDIGDGRVHVLASHPTPPAFDGPEERNVRRNHDENRLWFDYIRGGDNGDYIYDDDGNEGPLDDDASFIIAGDLNADPVDSDEFGIVAPLLGHDRITDPEPSSEGGRIASEQQGGVNDEHQGDPSLVTSDWNPQTTGNLRVDYAIPSSDLDIDDSAVFWPAPGQPHADIVDASDHRLVWVDAVVEY